MTHTQRWVSLWSDFGGELEKWKRWELHLLSFADFFFKKIRNADLKQTTTVSRYAKNFQMKIILGFTFTVKIQAKTLKHKSNVLCLKIC